jgi:NAD(P) transhydrogenase subunit alpha
MKVAVLKENAPGERRVALAPEGVPKLMAAGAEVLVESGAGEEAWFPDSAYAQAGAAIVSGTELYAAADVILTVTRPGPEDVRRLRAGQAIFGMLSTLTNPELAPCRGPSRWMR